MYHYAEFSKIRSHCITGTYNTATLAKHTCILHALTINHASHNACGRLLVACSMQSSMMHETCINNNMLE